MSISSLARRGAARNVGEPREPQTNAKPEPGAATTAVAPDNATKTKDAVTDAIPSEALALYTGVLLAIVSFKIEDHSSHSYIPLRWGIFAGGCVLVLLWLTILYDKAATKAAATMEAANKGKLDENKQQVVDRKPVAEVAAGLLAFATLAFALPDSPIRAHLDGQDETLIVNAITAIGGAIVFGISAKYLKKKASA